MTRADATTRRSNAAGLSASTTAGVGHVREVQREGRTWLTFPMIPLREGTLDYPERQAKEFISGDAVRSNLGDWAGAPLFTEHPENAPVRKKRTPGAEHDGAIGHVESPELIGGEALRVQAWIDVERANAAGGRAADVVDRLRAGEELGVSAGYELTGIDTRGGRHNGESYDAEQLGVRAADHVAIFAGEDRVPRCRPEDGCGAPRANSTDDETTESEDTTMSDTTQSTDDAPSPTTIQRVLRFLSGGNGQRANADAEPTADAAGGGEPSGGGLDLFDSVEQWSGAVEHAREHSVFDVGPADGELQQLLAAREAGWRHEGCGHEDALCNCVKGRVSQRVPDDDEDAGDALDMADTLIDQAAEARAAFAQAPAGSVDTEGGVDVPDRLDADVARELAGSAPGGRSNATDATTSPDTADDGQRYIYDGGRSVEDYPAGGRSDYEQRQNAPSDPGQASRDWLPSPGVDDVGGGSGGSVGSDSGGSPVNDMPGRASRPAEPTPAEESGYYDADSEVDQGVGYATPSGGPSRAEYDAAKAEYPGEDFTMERWKAWKGMQPGAGDTAAAPETSGGSGGGAESGAEGGESGEERENLRRTRRTNYGAVPGQVDRTPDRGDSVDDYPATRGDYEQRANASDGDEDAGDDGFGCGLR